MPLLKDAENLPSPCSKKYLVVRDAGILAFDDGKSDRIVLPPYVVRFGLICARHPAIAKRLDEFNDPTYQELEKRVDHLVNISFEDVAEIEGLKDCLEELGKAQLEVVAELNAQLDALKSRNWWQRLFG